MVYIGITVVLTTRDEKKDLEAVEKLKEYGMSDYLVFHQLDVTNPNSIDSLVNFIKPQFGKLNILSHWKGYLARRESKEQLLDLRLRVQESARNVDDSKRLINRLLPALSELLNMKSLSNILHTCLTLDMATRHSQRCCEELVAVDTLLWLTRSVSRSIPDQEVLKHALSTLRNLSCYPHLLEVLIQSQGSVQTIVLALLRFQYLID